ncbi:MAG: iron ABC transporter permease, partial [Calditrichaeota bacterium]
ATPYTLGVSTGGAVGALLIIKTGWMLSAAGLTGVQVAAFLGSLMTIGLVYMLSRRFGRLSIHSMILVGVTINYIFSAVILILHYLADFTETHQMIRWTIGGLDVVDYATLMRSLPVVGLSLLLFLGMSRALNILSTSEEMALSKGVNVGRVQKGAFLAASLLTGTMVSLTGPIGFVGLIIPHLLRLVLGPDHRYLLPAVFCFGGGFLVLADTIARTVMAPLDLPVGIITTLIGGPFFLYLLIRRRA